MELSLLLMASALTWLLIETDLLCVRLVAGPVAVLEPEIRAAWDTFDWSAMKYKTYQDIWKVPLCGWDWITGREHIIPEYRIEFNIAGCRYKMRLKSTPKAAKALGEVMKVNAKGLKRRRRRVKV